MSFDKNIIIILENITGAVAGMVELPDILQQTLNTNMEILEADACSIFIKDEENPNLIKCVAGTGYSQEIKGKAFYKTGEGLTGTVFKKGEYQKIDSKEHLEEVKSLWNWKGKHDDIQWKDGKEFKNLIALPLKTGKEILGVIKVENKKTAPSFTDEDLRNFQIIATIISLTIKNALLQEKKEQQANTIIDVLADVSGDLDLKSLLDKITKTVMKKLKAEVLSIFLKQKDNPNIIECVAAAGYAERLMSIEKHNGKPAFYEKGEGFTGHVFASGKPYNITEKSQLDALYEKGIWKKKFNAEQFKGEKDQCDNIIAIPLKRKDETFGVIKIENKIKQYGDYFSEDDFETFQIIANIVSLVIENAELSEKIASQLTTSQLTNATLMAAHKINNQATTYVGIKRLLMREGHTDKKIIDKLDETNRNLAKLIEDFNNFAKPLVLHKDLENINYIIEDAVDVLNEKSTNSENGIQVNCQLDKNINPFLIDTTRLSENITQLINNAKRAIIQSQQSSGEVLVSTNKTSFKDNKPAISIKVQDNGPGIKDNSKIFEPYYTTDPKGTGLGLAIVKKTVEAHGGEIKLLPYVEGEGACFEILLPL